MILCTAVITSKTGVEMEALTGASVAALTIYDMCKALSHDIVIKETRLIKKKPGVRAIIMASKPHQKHAALARPKYGDFGRLELSILGAPCDTIHEFAMNVAANIGNKWNIAFVDADHKKVPDEPLPAAFFIS